MPFVLACERSTRAYQQRIARRNDDVAARHVESYTRKDTSALVTCASMPPRRVQGQVSDRTSRWWTEAKSLGTKEGNPLQERKWDSNVVFMDVSRSFSLISLSLPGCRASQFDLRGSLHNFSMDKLGGALGVCGRGEHCTVVSQQHLQPGRDVRCMVFARLKGEL